MADAIFQKYVRGEADQPLIDQIYSELLAHVDETRGLMAALGTFWSEGFGSITRSQTAYETMVHAVTGCVLPLSDAFRGLIDVTLEASIQTIPVLADRQLELAVFSEDTDKAIMEEIEVERNGSMVKAYVFHETPIIYASHFVASLVDGFF